MAIRQRTRSRPIMSTKPAGEVGYGKPPQHTRFQTGKSGNPRGRPRQVLALDPVLNRTLSRKVPVARNGSTTTLSMLEAIVEQLAVGAAKGNNSSQRIVLKLLADQCAALAKAEATAVGQSELASDGSDEETLALYREEIRAELLSEVLDETTSRGPYIKKEGKK